jgi:hypothetical protein
MNEIFKRILTTIFRELFASVFPRQLAQVRPAGTAAVDGWSPDFFGQFEVTLIHCANVSGAAINISLFHDINGTTYDEDTALTWVHEIPAGGVYQLESSLVGYSSLENFGVQCSVADGVTFTFYGILRGEVFTA